MGLFNRVQERWHSERWHSPVDSCSPIQNSIFKYKDDVIIAASTEPVVNIMEMMALSAYLAPFVTLDRSLWGQE